MSIKNLIIGALINIKANKLRVFLTMIGIIIGISSVVVVLSIGDGLKAQVSESTGKANANKVSMSFNPSNPKEDISYLSPFTDQDIDNIKRIDGVEKVEQAKETGMLASLQSSGINGDVSFLDRSVNIFAKPYDNKEKSSGGLFGGSSSDSSEKPSLLAGRYFQSGDEESDVMVLSYDTAKKLFTEPENGVGKAISLNSTMFEVIGVTKKAEGIFSTNEDLVQNASVKRLNSEKDKEISSTIKGLDVYISPGRDYDSVIDKVKENLQKSHENIDGSYEAYNPADTTKIFETIISSITMFITLITAISLFVGGIGVMNIMYVSVTERKREIGIRRAIGATPQSIMLQFLFEAMFVTLLGGLIGIGLGYLLSQIAGMFMPFAPVLTLKTFIGSSATSIIVGIVFGMIPAYKASKLDPIKAIYN